MSETPENLYADADRVELTDEDGATTWVVLAEDRLDDEAYALAADEAEMFGPSDDMTIAVFRTSGRGRQRTLEIIEDDALENRVFDHFSELMGLG